MKAKPAKPEKFAEANKSAGKPATAVKKAGKVSADKTVLKKVAAANSKTALKVVVKSASKVKPVVKKPASKSALKSSLAKAKTPVKAVAKAKAPVKTVAKPTPKAALKPTPKVPAKVAIKPAVKPAAKPGANAVAKSMIKPVAKSMAVAVGKKAQLAASLLTARNPAVPAKPILASNGLPPPPPLKPGRRSSSRALAHMPPPAPMVPTHAPNAAKASYSTMTERVIAPPPHVAAKKDPKLANNWKTKKAESLTDEEVKAMPDAEYMNDKQMAFFRYKLSILKQDIHNSAGATTEHLREDTAVVPDPADRATIEEEHALELRTRDRERKLLKKIEQSIARIDSGDYGYCDETGEPIGVGRLIARPTASLSLEAQQRRELKQKMFGD